MLLVTLTPFFSDKGNYGTNIKLIEEEVLQNDSEIMEKFIRFCKNAVSTLGNTGKSFTINEEYKNISDPVNMLLQNSSFIQVFL